MQQSASLIGNGKCDCMHNLEEKESEILMSIHKYYLLLIFDILEHDTMVFNQ